MRSFIVLVRLDIFSPAFLKSILLHQNYYIIIFTESLLFIIERGKWAFLPNLRGRGLLPAICYDESMKHFTPKLWLGMTATPDKRDDNEEGRNVYELFNYQIAYEIRLQQAMEENLLCPFHYFGITDLSIVGDEEESGRDFSVLTGD